MERIYIFPTRKLVSNDTDFWKIKPLLLSTKTDMKIEAKLHIQE